MDRDKDRTDVTPHDKDTKDHPIGTAAGATAGAVYGAGAGGVVGGPVGAVIGGVVGAVAGGAAGRGAAELINPTEEDKYWRENYRNRPYYRSGREYTEYEPAYRYGWESATRPEYRERRFEEVETDLERGWDRAKGTTRQTWYDVKDATRDAWDRVRGRA
jgi:uncharacterized protein YcfJ